MVSINRNGHTLQVYDDHIVVDGKVFGDPDGICSMLLANRTDAIADRPVDSGSNPSTMTSDGNANMTNSKPTDPQHTVNTEYLRNMFGNIMSTPDEPTKCCGECDERDNKPDNCRRRIIKKVIGKSTFTFDFRHLKTADDLIVTVCIVVRDGRFQCVGCAAKNPADENDDCIGENVAFHEACHIAAMMYDNSINVGDYTNTLEKLESAIWGVQ